VTILTSRQVWSRALPAKVGRAPEFTDSEIAAVKRALRFLVVQFNGGAKLAAALRVSRPTITRALGPGGKPSPTIVLRVARLAGQPVDRVLDGSFPPERACPHCGRGYARPRSC
jgi:hypothetical protein